MQEVKDSIANVTTIGGVASVIMQWESVFTLLLIVTGIVLNVTRIYEWWKKKDKKDI